MIARCARCQQTFPTETFGTQKCPHCGAEIHLADPAAPRPPAAPPPRPTAQPPPAAPPPAWGAPPPPAGGGWGAPPPPPPPWGGAGAPPPGGFGPLPPGPPPSGWGPLPPGAVPPSSEAPHQPSPFADRQRLGLVQAWIQTWKLVALEPARFFRLVRVDQTGAALLFGVIGASIGAVVSGVFSFFSVNAALGAMQPFLEKLREQGVDPELLQRFAGGATGVSLLAQILLAPLFSFVAIYVASALFHAVLLLVKGAPRGFSATLTVVAHAYGIFLLTALPMCGGLVALVWFTVAAIIGLAEAHRSATWKGARAVFSPLLLLCLCACIAGIAIPNLSRLQGKGGGPVSL